MFRTIALTFTLSVAVLAQGGQQTPPATAKAVTAAGVTHPVAVVKKHVKRSGYIIASS